ncbi:thioesterase family protein [Candidatus Kapabacteria bacterium]|nr:thioesterase family protein [Candidatus Kapabacteria bacterium]
MSKLLEHKCVFRVRYADTDKMGIVYNGNYFTFFETGRTELMRHFNLAYTLVEENGFLLPLTEANISYKSPARYDDILEIFAKLEYDNSLQIKFEYEIKILEKLIAKGYTKHVFVTKEKMRPVKPPKFFLDLISE